MTNVDNITVSGDNILKQIFETRLSNDDLIQIIELCGSQLNLMTITNYAKENGLSYNGVKNYRNTIELFGVKFAFDND